ncbi:MAG: glycosyltransferase family 4 protein, partial [Bdellovibrionales bacterium]|nr:glycosyltransferase family 4 protein [Bdellovibrionales bacterium]
MSLSVVIDARKVGDGGIGVYIENLVDGLLDLGLIDAGELDLHLLVTPEFEFGKGSSEVQACAERWRGKVQTVVEYAKKYSLSEYLQIGRRHRALFRKADVFHAPHYTLPLNIGCPTVVTVHDVIHVSHPETFYHRPVSAFLISSALQRATEVITVSHASAQVLKNLVRDPGKLIHVIPNAVRREIGQSTPREIEVLKRSRRIHRPYCMFVGNDRPHKGFRELVDAWMILKRRLRERGFQTPELFAVGNRFQPSTLRLVSSCGLADDIRFLGEVGTVELGHLYCGARAVIVPSRVEGFGLPALEGMASGVPVICTPVASLR